MIETNLIIVSTTDSKDAVGITFDNINGNYKNLEDGIKMKFQTTLKVGIHFIFQLSVL